MNTLSRCLVIALSIGSIVATANSQRIKTVTVKKGSGAALMLGTALSSRQSVVGDQVTCTLRDAVKVGPDIVIPSGTQILGHVVSVTPWFIGQRQSEIRLVLDKIVSPTGKFPINLHISSIDQRDRDRGTVEPVTYGSYRKIGKAGGTSTSTTGNTYVSVNVPTVPTGGGNDNPLPHSVSVFGDGLGGNFTACGGDVRLRAGTVLRVRFAEPLTVHLLAKNTEQRN